MKLRGWTILWTVLGVAAAGVACVWLLVRADFLPREVEFWMDAYTGNLKQRDLIMGFTVRWKPVGNFSSGLVPGGNLAEYKDPQGRSEWILVGRDPLISGYGIAADTPAPLIHLEMLAESQAPSYSVLRAIASAINSDPRPGFKYDPPNGYSKQAKKYVLLNCLQIARETRDAGLIDQYYDYTVETLRPLERKAYPDDLPDVDEFLAAHKTGSRR